MTNNSNGFVAEPPCDVFPSLTMISEGLAVNNESSQVEESTDPLIKYVDKNKSPNDHRMTSQSHAIAASNTHEQLDSAIKLLCSKFTIKTFIEKKSTGSKPPDGMECDEYVQSACDIVPTKTNKIAHTRKQFNNVVKQCSVFAFQDLCESMSEILSQINSSLSKSSLNSRKYRKDIELSSQLLMSVKNITHGMFLHQGGYYSKLVYDRKVSESNAKSIQVQSKQLYSDLHHARKLMYEFLYRISCQSGKPISKSQPKRLSLSENKNVKTSGSVTKLPYR
jgi:hypothetical protein